MLSWLPARRMSRLRSFMSVFQDGYSFRMSSTGIKNKWDRSSEEQFTSQLWSFPCLVTGISERGRLKHTRTHFLLEYHIFRSCPQFEMIAPTHRPTWHLVAQTSVGGCMTEERHMGGIWLLWTQYDYKKIWSKVTRDFWGLWMLYLLHSGQHLPFIVPTIGEGTIVRKENNLWCPLIPEMKNYQPSNGLQRD